MKRLSVSALLILIVIMLTASVSYGAREEIVLRTIVPDQHILRVQKGIVSETNYKPSIFPNTSIPAKSLIIEGNVGIGTTAPNAKLEVAGDIISDTVGYDLEGAYRYCKINGHKTKIYTKYFSGMLDDDGMTLIVHEISSALTKILHVSGHVFSDLELEFHVVEAFWGNNLPIRWVIRYDATNIILGGPVGANIQGNAYRLKVDYIL